MLKSGARKRFRGKRNGRRRRWQSGALSPMRSSAWRREADQSDRETGVGGGALVADSRARASACRNPVAAYAESLRRSEADTSTARILTVIHRDRYVAFALVRARGRRTSCLRCKALVESRSSSRIPLSRRAGGVQVRADDFLGAADRA